MLGDKNSITTACYIFNASTYHRWVIQKDVTQWAAFKKWIKDNKKKFDSFQALLDKKHYNELSLELMKSMKNRQRSAEQVGSMLKFKDGEAFILQESLNMAANIYSKKTAIARTFRSNKLNDNIKYILKLTGSADAVPAVLAYSGVPKNTVKSVEKRIEQLKDEKTLTRTWAPKLLQQLKSFKDSNDLFAAAMKTLVQVGSADYITPFYKHLGMNDTQIGVYLKNLVIVRNILRNESAFKDILKKLLVQQRSSSKIHIRSSKQEADLKKIAQDLIKFCQTHAGALKAVKYYNSKLLPFMESEMVSYLQKAEEEGNDNSVLTHVNAKNEKLHDVKEGGLTENIIQNSLQATLKNQKKFAKSFEKTVDIQAAQAAMTKEDEQAAGAQGASQLFDKQIEMTAKNHGLDVNKFKKIVEDSKNGNHKRA